MAAYIVFIREGPVRDQGAMAEYRKGKPAPGVTMKALAAYGAQQSLEGEAPDGVVILEFPTVEEARAWYDSPEYQERIPFRRKAADYRAVIVQGL